MLWQDKLGKAFTDMSNNNRTFASMIINDLHDLSGDFIDISEGVVSAEHNRTLDSYWVFQLFRSVINNNLDDISGNITQANDVSDVKIDLSGLRIR